MKIRIGASAQAFWIGTLLGTLTAAMLLLAVYWFVILPFGAG